MGFTLAPVPKMVQGPSPEMSWADLRMTLALMIWDPDRMQPRQSSMKILALSMVRWSMSESFRAVLISAICWE